MNSGAALIDPKEIFNKISLGTGMRVADLGCSRTGHFVFSASKVVGNTGIVYAVDIIKDILASIQNQANMQGAANIETVWSDIEKYGKVPIPEKSLDVCFLVNVVYLLSDKKNAFKEAARLLKQKGFLVVIDWKRKIGPLGPNESAMVSPEEVIALAAEANLQLFDRIVINDYHYAVILKKE